MKTLALLALTVGVVQAQETTLTYHGLDMSGTATTLNTSTAMVIASSALDASFLVQLDISGSLADHDLKLLSADLIVDHHILDLPNLLIGEGGPDFCSMSSCIDLTTKNGRITGATIAISGSGSGVMNTANIGPAGDSFYYAFGDPGATCNRASGECILTAANKTPGTWTVATTSVPEIDPTSAGSGLMLLCGSLAVLGSRRKSAPT